MPNPFGLFRVVSAIIYEDGTTLVRITSHDGGTHKLRTSITFETNEYQLAQQLENYLDPQPQTERDQPRAHTTQRRPH